MKTMNVLKVVAPAMAAAGVTGLICVSYVAARHYDALDLHETLHFMPTWVIRFVGIMNVVTYLPVFVLGFLTLKPDGAIGKAESLCTGSVYHYLRNPMYAGLSFTVLGAGLILGKTQVAAAGLLWLTVCYFVTLIEEKSLTRRFGSDYLEYKKNTPRFVPDFEVLIADMLAGIKKICRLGN
jgi:protein-S-isoprenylcysteine O-methyltransferase Ste14